ncbi:hypothetical protein RJ640_013903, partial [Escallonia rubra]
MGLCRRSYGIPSGDRGDTLSATGRDSPPSQAVIPSPGPPGITTGLDPEISSPASPPSSPGLFSYGSEPRSYKVASHDPKWRVEIDALEANGTWTIEDLPPGKKPIGSKWVYKIKFNSDESIERYRVRVVVQGDTQVEGLDYTETFAVVAKMVSVRVVMDNGLLNVTLSTPTGFVTAIQFNGMYNVLEYRNKESKRGYWDVVWSKPGSRANIFDVFIMLRGSPGFYSYAIFEHFEGLPAVNIAESRMAFQLQQDWFHYMALSDARQKFMPSPWDRAAGKVDDKYQYSCDHKDNRVSGWPFLTGHYAGNGLTLTLQDGEPWKKVFGPVFIYLNSGKPNNDPRTLWDDAKKQMLIETKSWPYDFPLSQDFPHANQRGTISGRLLVRDRYISRVLINASSAHVGLAPPGEAGSWQRDTRGYQFWNQTDLEGNFMIRGVRPGTYNLYGWVPGFIGDYKYNLPVNMSPGDDIQLGDIVYNPPRNGFTIWEIGIPDRTAAEFFVPNPRKTLMTYLSSSSSDRFRQYGLWDRYTDLYPKEDLVYTVGASNYSKDWFFAHVTRWNPETNSQGTNSSPPVQLRRVDNDHVVMENGLLKVTLSTPTGFVTEIQYNGLDNVLEYRNKESKRGYWDVVWSKPGYRRNIFDLLRGTQYSVIAEDENRIEVSFTKTWNSSLDDEIPINIDKRFHYMALSDDRQKFMPSPWDRAAGEVLDYPEAVHLTNSADSDINGVDDKYQYSCDNKDGRVSGWVSTDKSVGFWVIIPSDEFRTGGPVKQDLTSHVGPTTLAPFISGHYAGIDLTLRLQDGEPWKKVFGPIFIYLNSGKPNNDPRTLWEDAKEQMLIETKSWPYDFPLSQDFPHANQRSTISGRLLVRERYISTVLINASSAYVGLAPPGEAGSWQKDTRGYQFWNQTDSQGNFMIRGVRPGTYNLYGWVPGFIGDYKYNFSVNISPGDDIQLGDIVYDPPRNGFTLWEIGIPDRSAAEFFVPDPRKTLMTYLSSSNSDRFRQYGLWDRYTDLYPEEDLVYTVGASNYSKDWFFAHVTRDLGNKTHVPTTWRIVFDLPYVVPTRDYYTLRLALASATSARLQ